MSEWQVHLKDSHSHAMSALFCSLSLLILNVLWHSQDNHFLTWNTCLTYWTSNPPLSLVWTSFTSALLAKWHHLYSYLSVSDTLFFISKIWTLLMWLLTPIIAAMCFPSEVFGAEGWCFFSWVFILMWPNIWDQFWGIGFLNSQS